MTWLRNIEYTDQNQILFLYIYGNLHSVIRTKTTIDEFCGVRANTIYVAMTTGPTSYGVASCHNRCSLGLYPLTRLGCYNNGYTIN